MQYCAIYVSLLHQEYNLNLVKIDLTKFLNIV